MASKYTRDRSPYYWIKTKIGAPPGSYRRYATRFEVGNSAHTRACNEEIHKLSAKEYATAGTAMEERWEAWMPSFLSIRYRKYPKSLLRYKTAWRTISMFLEQREILTPRQLTRGHCFEYLAWRAEPNKSKGKYKAGHNTTLLELKFLGLVMKEAVHRNFAPANPCRELNLERDQANKPSEFTAEDMAKIEEAIATEPAAKQAFLLPSFQIARSHGVRLIETHIDPIQSVDLQRGSIVFLQKGGRTREKPIHPRLVPMFAELQSKHARESFPMPKSFAKEWHNFFKRHPLPSNPTKPCFHSFRVTVENQMRRAGVPKEIRMAYLSHETKDVNAGYDRFTLEELKCCHAAL